MKFIKKQSGLLENPHYFSTAPMVDLMGDGVFERTHNSFTLTQSTVERRVPYDEFVIYVEKETFGNFWFYLRDEHKNASLIESEQDSTQIKCWSCVRKQGFTEFYSKEKNEKWKSVGGLEHPKYPIQGFTILNKSLKIVDYKVFSRPYVTITNLAPNTPCQLSTRSDYLQGRTDDSGSVQFFLLGPEESVNFYYNSEQITIREMYPGDVWQKSDLKLELHDTNYKIDPYRGSTWINTDIYQLRIKNADTKRYENVVISLLNHDNKVDLDWENTFVNPVKQLTTPLDPDQMKPFFVRINKFGDGTPKHFQIMLGGE